MFVDLTVTFSCRTASWQCLNIGSVGLAGPHPHGNISEVMAKQSTHKMNQHRMIIWPVFLPRSSSHFCWVYKFPQPLRLPALQHYFKPCFYISMDRFKGKSAAKRHISWEKIWFPVFFPIIQFCGYQVTDFGPPRLHVHHALRTMTSSSGSMLMPSSTIKANALKRP